MNSEPVEVRVWAHRGASAETPENTLAAFRRAVEIGVGGIELDVQLTRDGVPVVLHDPTLERTTDGRGWVGDWTWSELRRLDAGAWFHPRFAGERIPTLAEALVAIPEEVWINIELKTTPEVYRGLEEQVVNCVRASGRRRIIYSSFDHSALERLQRIDPEARLGLLYDGFLLSPWKYARQAGLRIYSLHVRHWFAGRGLAQAARRKGLAVFAYTVNDPRRAAHLFRSGVHGVFTDNPRRVRG
ncbi:glycerophosphodiester phosphodiesterase [Kyrpidia tusciae]|uniref:Glycerophosphoryl diester phosphodiesterase n=1 Tax=Kyrpidia tusciae (strain DSM 2912 / NBRC 15312 / T2) TaxID=562970 RepID=D5WT49_KYRT2|nr:glycerophosphodiester phosphodiesterase [Kyrpidia tusciae]ADG05153.1 glycerophosphoryl diester phosphodiesterase [Kyrpidia tusciae DSM 2912]